MPFDIRQMSDAEIIELCNLHRIAPDQEYKRLAHIGAAVDYEAEAELIAQLAEIRRRKTCSPEIKNLAKSAMVKFYRIAAHALRSGGIIDACTMRAIYPALRRIVDAERIIKLEARLKTKEAEIRQRNEAIAKFDELAAELEDFRERYRAAVERLMQ